MYKTLCLSGGGVKGVAFIGTLQVLKEKNILINIDHYIGTSVGSILAWFLTIGYTPNELYDHILEYDFSKINNFEFLDFLNKFGVDNGKNLMRYIKKISKKKGWDYNITFLEHYKKTSKKLSITGTCLNTISIDTFNYITTPNMKIKKALRISTSIPILFEHVKYKKNIYVDGGIINNLPMDIADDKCIGIDILTAINKDDDFSKLPVYIDVLVKCMTHKYMSTFKKKYKDDIIDIAAEDIIFYNFNITISQKRELYNMGYESASKFFNNKFMKH